MPQQQLSCSYLHSSRMLLVTSNSALPIQGQSFKGTASNAATRISPWISDTRTLCTFQGCNTALPQNPPALPVASLAPIQEVLLFQNEAALGMLLVYSTPYGSCIPLRCSATLGLLPAVKPNTADGNVQYFIHCDTDTVQHLAGSLQAAAHANMAVTQHHSTSHNYDPNTHFC